MNAQRVDGLGKLPSPPGTAAELAQDPPGLELGIGTLAGAAQPGMGPVGVLLRGGLDPAPVRRADRVFAEVALVAQRDQAAGGQGLDDAPDPGRGQVVRMGSLREAQRPPQLPQLTEAVLA
jgi:hypothetical protein